MDGQEEKNADLLMNKWKRFFFNNFTWGTLFRSFRKHFFFFFCLCLGLNSNLFVLSIYMSHKVDNHKSSVKKWPLKQVKRDETIYAENGMKS